MSDWSSHLMTFFPEKRDPVSQWIWIQFSPKEKQVEKSFLHSVCKATLKLRCNLGGKNQTKTVQRVLRCATLKQMSNNFFDKLLYRELCSVFLFPLPIGLCCLSNLVCHLFLSKFRNKSESFAKSK